MSRSWTTRRASSLLASMAMLILLWSTWPASADPDPRYKPGDWRAYTSLRFVTSAAVTTDYVYFGTRGGVARYDRFARRWAPALTTAEGLPSNIVFQLAYNDETDELYASTLNGSSVYRRVWDEWRYAPIFPESLIQDWREANIAGLQLPFDYDALEPGYLTDPHLRSYRIVGSIEDTYGNEWIGTWGGFVWMHPFAINELVPQSGGLYHNNVEAIYLDHGTMYFAGPNHYTTEGALTIYDTADASWQYIEARFTDGFASDGVHRFAGEPGGRYLFMATDLGVVRYDRKKMSFRTYGRSQGLRDDRVNTICLDGEILWVGTESGIQGIYTPTDSVFLAETGEVLHARVQAIAATHEVVWLGTDRGLFRLVKPEPVWMRFDRADGALSRPVRSLRVGDGKLYVGMERGLGIIDLTFKEPAKVYETVDGLPDDNIFDVAITDSIVWAATPSGLVRFVPATRERRVITTADGLLETFVQTIEVEGDYLWLGTENGVNRFRWNNPHRID